MRILASIAVAVGIVDSSAVVAADLYDRDRRDGVRERYDRPYDDRRYHGNERYRPSPEPPPTPAQMRVPRISGEGKRWVCHPQGHTYWRVTLKDCRGACVAFQHISGRCGWVYGPIGAQACVDVFEQGRLRHHWWYLLPIEAYQQQEVAGERNDPPPRPYK